MALAKAATLLTDKKSILAKNLFILSAGKFSAQLILLILLPLYTIYLTPKQYGFIDLALTYIILLAPIATLQLEMAVFRYLIDARKDEANKKAIISNVLQISSYVLLLLILAYLIISEFIHIEYLLLIFLNIASTIFVNIFLQIARGLGDNKRFAIASAVTGIVSLISTVLLVAVAKQGITGILFSFFIANIFCVMYLIVSLKLHRYINPLQKSNGIKRSLLNYSVPLVPNGISWWVLSISDRTVIAVILGFAANGIYAVSNKYVGVFSSLFLVFNMAITESIVVNINAKDRDSFLTDISSMTLKIFGSLGIILIAFCPLIFSIGVGRNFRSASQYVPILVVAALLYAISSLYNAVYIAKKLTSKVALTSIYSAIINITLTLSLIKYFGIYAAAISTAVAYFFMVLFRHYNIKKYIKFHFEKLLIVKLLIIYLIVFSIFYTHSTIGNYVNIFISLFVSLYFNKPVVKSLLDRKHLILSPTSKYYRYLNKLKRAYQ